MVVEYGMSSLGPIQYEKNSGSVFLGRDYGNAQKNISLAVADEIDKKVRKIVEGAHCEAIRIITERKDDVILIAETLLQHETINEEEIAYLLEHRKLPEETVSQRQAASQASFHSDNSETNVTNTVEQTHIESPSEEQEIIIPDDTNSDGNTGN